MTLHKLSIFNMNELLLFEYKNLDNLKIGNLEKINYFHPNISCSLLKQIWSERYNIKIKNLLISQNRYYHTKNTSLFDVIKQGILTENFRNLPSFQLKLKLSPNKSMHRSFWILNKENVILLNETMHTIIFITNKYKLSSTFVNVIGI